MASKKKDVDPVDQLGKDLAAEHTLAKASGRDETLDQEDIVDDTKKSETVDELADKLDAHERNMQHLEELAVNAEFESGTLVGDIRDFMLQLYKERSKNWSQCSAGEQRDLVAMATTVAKKVIKKVALVVAGQDNNSVHATLKGYSAGDGFDIKLKANSDEETALELYRMQGHEVIIISADARKFEGQRKDADIEEDQAPLPFSDPKPEPQQSDGTETDLADAAGDVDENSDAQAETIPEGEKPEQSSALPVYESGEPYQPVDDDGEPITKEQEDEWASIKYVTRNEPEFPELNDTWANPETGEVLYWHGAKQWQTDEFVVAEENNEAE